MQKYETQVALEKLRDARRVEKEAVNQFNAQAESILHRLILEAAVNHMTVAEVAEHSGYTKDQIKRRMKAMDLNRIKGKRLLAETAAKALTENAALLDVDPFSIMNSPLAYLPMGEALRQELADSRVARVTELDDEPKVSDLGERIADCGCCTIVDTVALRELIAKVSGNGADE